LCGADFVGEERRMPQLFLPYADTIARTVLIAIVGAPILAVGVAYWVSASEYVTGRSITYDQPVPFSHQHHVGGLGLDCRYCHGGVESSAIAGIPPTHTCMTCHSQLYTQTAMLAPVRASLANGQPIRWNKVNKLPDYVYFDHSIHIAKGVGCTTCHGDVAQMPLMRQAEPLTMGWCLDCHRDPAPYLRPAADIFDPDWRFPSDQAERGAVLAHQLIDNKHLTDCSVCHR
jgi:Cytochrome c7 and related cytochrome c